MLTTFDLDVLRSFAVGMELGGFAKAADCLGRSTSAVSAQLKKLEQQAGTPIFRRNGRRLALTEAGEVMLAYARRLIALNDEAANALHDVNLEGWVRLGVQEHFGEMLLPKVLGSFARAHPKVKIEARVARKTELLARVAAGSLDLALAWDDETFVGGERVAELPMRWIGPVDEIEGWSRSSGEPLPLAAAEAPCLFRATATAALDRAGIPWRIAFTSPTLTGLWAAMEAGLGFMVLTEFGLPARVRVVGDRVGLPSALPRLALSLHQADAGAGPAVARLADIVRQAVRDSVQKLEIPPPHTPSRPVCDAA
ncbi:MAG TPA: LysR substrate-binding domain-containing protein [Aliidongia sp.]|uniref:LysR substrate-binding domain-containing protein n=1 Tax=Aliidongia sp. TaxID=1914230 RepID=UPI002DDCAA47|nr:LysR substrate-binding domain-containing protein [Aliidongia sp.]HEV2674196.1 LysR substrate-binding domain-containing protein [Aliidongia sp.]